MDTNPLLFVLPILLLAGCASEKACEKPYSLVGKECCLDGDGKGICDTEEVIETSTTTTATLSSTTTTTSVTSTTEPGPVCETPYIPSGSNCCFDGNGNGACDAQEAPAPKPTAVRARAQISESNGITFEDRRLSKDSVGFKIRPACNTTLIGIKHASGDDRLMASLQDSSHHELASAPYNRSIAYVNHTLVKGETYYVVATGGGNAWVAMTGYNPYARGPISTGTIYWLNGTISVGRGAYKDSTREGGSVSALIVTGCEE